MTIAELSHHPRVAARRADAPSHRFAVGQTVRLKRRFGAPSSGSETFRVTATLPFRDNSPQYRVRSDEERHERVTAQDDLEPVDTLPPGSDATLAERTFGNGQRTKA